MTNTKGESLLKLVGARGGVRADADSREPLNGLVADGLLFLETGPPPSPGSPSPEPIYRLTDEGKKLDRKSVV